MLQNWRDWSEHRDKFSHESFSRLVHNSDELYKRLLDASIDDLRTVACQHEVGSGWQGTKGSGFRCIKCGYEWTTSDEANVTQPDREF